MTARSRKKQPTRYHHGRLRPALVDAALVLVKRSGPRGLSLRAVARRAGVSPTAVYRHFPDRLALLAAVAESGFVALRDAMLAAGDDDALEPVVRLQRMGMAYVRFATSHGALYSLMFGAELADKRRHPALDAAAGEAFGLLVEGVAAAQNSGAVTPGDPRELALAAWSLVHGMANLILAGQLVDVTKADSIDALSGRIAATLFQGLRAS